MRACTTVSDSVIDNEAAVPSHPTLVAEDDLLAGKFLRVLVTVTIEEPTFGNVLLCAGWDVC